MRVKMLKAVRPDFYLDPPDIVIKLPRLELKHGRVYPATSNRCGALCGVDQWGREVGVKPDEIEVILSGKEWCDFANAIRTRDIDIGEMLK